MRCRVIKPMVRMSPDNGFDSFDEGAVIEIEDPAEAQRFVDAGAVEILDKGRGSAPETAEKKIKGLEKAVKPGKESEP